MNLHSALLKIKIWRISRIRRVIPIYAPFRRLSRLAMSQKPTSSAFSRDEFDSVLRCRFFYAPSFEIYGGVSGLYDYGPAGCALQANILDIWKKHFILEEDMLEVDCTALTPAEVLKTSGHVDKFSDSMCKDPATGEIFRADHLVEEVLEARLKGDKEARGISGLSLNDGDKKRKKKVKEIKAVRLEEGVISEYEDVLARIDNFDGPQLGEIIAKYEIGNPVTGGKLEPPVDFNLMFETQIGPSGALKGYLRPETAQGQFLNFAKLLDYNNLRMPFASASIGKSFRNEISPRAGLLRVREFLMAEIEHFVDPKNKSHSRFDEVADVEISALPKGVQESGSTEVQRISIGEAVKTGMIDNETLGYFVGRIAKFMLKIGIDPNRMRFRQHMSNEMAHYASDCWDCELHTSYGWIECVGCADRSAYDLTVHSARTKEKLVVREKLEEPITVEKFEVAIDKKKFGPTFRKDAGKITTWLEAQTQCELETLADQLVNSGKVTATIDGGTFDVDASLVSISKVKRTEHVREYTPSVIEPSFGIGRCLYALLEHSFWFRPEDPSRKVLSFRPSVAPTKVLVVPLSTNTQFTPFIRSITRQLRSSGISARVDDSSASIGKRYARNDEIGTPFGLTIDFQTVADKSITLRERDSTNQKRGSIPDVIKALQQMVAGASWTEGTAKLKDFEGQEISE